MYASVLQALGDLRGGGELVLSEPSAPIGTARELGSTRSGTDDTLDANAFRRSTRKCRSNLFDSTCGGAVDLGGAPVRDARAGDYRDRCDDHQDAATLSLCLQWSPSMLGLWMSLLAGCHISCHQEGAALHKESCEDKHQRRAEDE